MKGRHMMINQSNSRKKWALILLCSVQFMSLVDTSIVQVAIPSIQQSINLPPRLSHWVLTGYAVMCGGFMLLGGRMGDIWGRRRMLTLGMALFTLASIWAGLAGYGSQLILARGFQGIGAAIMIPSVLSLFTIIFSEGHERNRALGLLGTISAVGFTSGLIVGGFLTDTMGWRSIFFINVPIGILILFLAPRLLPESVKVHQPLDVPGAITSTGSLIAILFALTTGDLYGWYSLITIGLTILSILLLIMFVVIEINVQYPMVPFHIFTQRPFSGAIIASFIFGSIMGSSIYITNLYMQNVLGYRPSIAAIAYLPQEFMTMVTAFFVGRWAVKFGTYKILVGGMSSFGLGLMFLANINPDVGYFTSILPGTLLIGLGAAMVLVSGSIIVTTQIQTEYQGVASGLWNTGPQIGTAFGIATLMAVASTRASSLQDQSHSVSMDNYSIWVSGFQAAFVVGIIFAGIGLCAAFIFNRYRKT